MKKSGRSTARTSRWRHRSRKRSPPLRRSRAHRRAANAVSPPAALRSGKGTAGWKSASGAHIRKVELECSVPSESRAVGSSRRGRAGAAGLRSASSSGRFATRRADARRDRTVSRRRVRQTRRGGRTSPADQKRRRRPQTPPSSRLSENFAGTRGVESECKGRPRAAPTLRLSRSSSRGRTVATTSWKG